MSDIDKDIERALEKLELLKSFGFRSSSRHAQTRVVSTEKVVCRAKRGETHNAILLIHEDGTITVKCSGECSDCEYGFPEF